MELGLVHLRARVADDVHVLGQVAHAVQPEERRERLVMGPMPPQHMQDCGQLNSVQFSREYR